MRRKWSRNRRLTLSPEAERDVRTPIVVSLVVIFHTVAVGSAFLFIQGCGTTTGPTMTEPPGAPSLPPTTAPSARSSYSRPTFQPPVPVAPAPAMIEPGSSKTYVIQKGDSLSKIAKRHGVSYRELAE